MSDSFKIEDNYVEKMNDIIYKKFKMSRLILENDYYRKVFNK